MIPLQTYTRMKFAQSKHLLHGCLKKPNHDMRIENKTSYYEHLTHLSKAFIIDVWFTKHTSIWNNRPPISLHGADAAVPPAQSAPQTGS